MTALNIYLFGSIQVIRDERQAVKLRPTTKAVFAYLLLHHYRNPHRPGQPREVLASRFWEDQDERQARRCLSTTLWRLRRELEPDSIPRGTYLLTSTGGEVAFNFDSDHWLDVNSFEDKANRGMKRPIEEMVPADVHCLEEALQLYTGELLEDCYGDWVIRERERLNLIYLHTLARLMRYFEHHAQYETSLDYGQKILAVDPLREQVHRHLMRLYLKCGQRAMAVQQYETCRAILAEELDIEPMAETQALFGQIMSMNGPANSLLPATTNKPGDLGQALHQLQAAIQNLEQAHVQLQQAKLMVARLAEPA